MPIIFSLASFLILFLLGRHMGKRTALLISASFTAFSLLLCLIYAYDVYFNGNISVINLGTWIHTSEITVSYKFLVDPLSISFATLIGFITLLILSYSY